ncbi:MAG TPA: GNAT family N-acetyltransferase [Chitinophagaceae bacterium]|jgi:GNAT superfamily N-acetyltransferase
MTLLKRTDSENKDFIELVKCLDAELAERDGADHSFYHQFNKIDKIRHAVVVYDGEKPIACGAIKELSTSSMEIKRMYTLPKERGKGIASKVLTELETWTCELGYEKCILETGKKQPEAIQLYKKSGYIQVPNYGQYVGIDNSICLEKKVS